MRTTDLAIALQQLLPPHRTPTLYVGPLRLGHALAERAPLTCVVPRRRRPRGPSSTSVVADPLQLPFARSSFACLILVDQLPNATRHGPTLLAEAAAALATDGRLLVVEPKGGLFRRRGAGPERLSALLLNAGYERIEQHWPAGQSVITSGRPGPFATRSEPTDG